MHDLVVAVKSLGDLWESNSTLQSLENIGLKVLSILNTAGDADKVVVDTNGLTVSLWDTGVCHGSWNLNKRLNTSQRLSKSENLGLLAEALSGGSSALDAEREHTTTHSVAVLPQGNGAVWVRVSSWVVDGNDMWGLLESGGNGGGVGVGLAGAEVEGLETTVGQPGVECGWDGTDGVLKESEAGLHVLRVEGADAHDNVGVAVDVLGNGVDDDVGTVVEWILDVWGEEGVVNDNHDAVLVGNIGDGADVDEAEGWVGWGLDPDELGVLGDVCLDIDLNLWGEGDLDIVCLGDLGEVSVGSSVDVGDGDDMGACGEGLEDHSGGGRAGGEGESILGVLKRGNGLLEVVSVWVGGAGVLVLADWLSDTGLGEGGGEGD